jgi:hypothetical protein
MTATRFTRTACVARLKALLDAAAPSGVTVTRGVNRDPATGPLIAIGDMLGVESGVPAMRAGRKAYDDRFTIEVLCIAWRSGVPDFDEVDAAAEVLGEVVRSTLADHPQLDDGTDGLPGVVSAVVTLADGPAPWRTNIGVGSVMRLEITVHARISGDSP